ncbi:MAG: ABC transporter ATP-binding protein [Candidatus Promineifilaceae bacterium]
MDIAVETHRLTKSFDRPAGWRRLVRQRGITAVDDVSLSVPAGELFGLLGPNGAGKTTLVKLLCTLILPTSGCASIAGYGLNQPGKIRQAVGLVVSDERSFYWRLSARRNLRFFAAMVGLRGSAAERRVEETLEAIDLRPFADQPFSTFSTGMKQRLAIGRSLMHRPRVLFLDEPSRSLDPIATGRLHALIQDLIASQGVTIFLITHDLNEAEKLCGRVALMHKGRIRVVGRPADLRRQLQPQLSYALRVSGYGPEAESALRGLAPDLRHTPAAGRDELRFQLGESDGRLDAVLDCLRRHQVTIHSIEGHPPSLEEVFAHYADE